jgi:hypothetical protein
MRERERERKKERERERERKRERLTDREKGILISQISDTYKM